MKRSRKKVLGFILLAIFLVSIFTLLFFFSPEEIVRKVGVNNSYILIFLVSFFGGFSSGGSVTFIGLLITLAVGGINPIYLGLISGIGLAIGDMIIFYAGSKGRELVNNKWDQKINKIVAIFEKRKWLKKMTPTFAYFYIGLTPLPNDILILFMAAIKYPPKKMNWIIILGDLTFALMVTLLAARGFLF